jgi:hypothetical protein
MMMPEHKKNSLCNFAIDLLGFFIFFSLTNSQFLLKELQLAMQCFFTDEQEEEKDEKMGP